MGNSGTFGGLQSASIFASPSKVYGLAFVALTSYSGDEGVEVNLCALAIEAAYGQYLRLPADAGRGRGCLAQVTWAW